MDTKTDDIAAEHHIERSNVLEPGAWYQSLRAQCPVRKDVGVLKENISRFDQEHDHQADRRDFRVTDRSGSRLPFHCRHRGIAVESSAANVVADDATLTAGWSTHDRGAPEPVRMAVAPPKNQEEVYAARHDDRDANDDACKRIGMVPGTRFREVVTKSATDHKPGRDRDCGHDDDHPKGAPVSPKRSAGDLFPSRPIDDMTARHSEPPINAEPHRRDRDIPRHVTGRPSFTLPTPRRPRSAE